MLTPEYLNITRHFLKLVLACGTPRLMVSKDTEENRLEFLTGCLCRWPERSWPEGGCQLVSCVASQGAP